MENSLEVSTQRELLKQEFDALIENTLPARILQIAGSLIQRLTRRSNFPPWYVSTIVLVIVSTLPQILFAVIVKQPEQVIGNGLIWSLSVVLIIQVIPITYLISRYVLMFINAQILEHMAESRDLESLGKFIRQRLGSLQGAFYYALLASLIWSLIAIPTFSFFNHKFIGIGLAIDVWIWGFCAPGVGLYFILTLLQLPSQMGNYHYQVYELNPAQSEAINHIAALFTRPFLAIAIYLAISTFIASAFSEFLWVVVVVVVIFWIPLIIQFINSQNAINKIISSAKWQTLNKLQERIRKHQADTNLDLPGNIEGLNKLMDLYERVYSTNSFRLTIKSTLEFLNQMLLPLLAFLISNYDSVLRFFKLKP
jgi:hypothetical protein